MQIPYDDVAIKQLRVRVGSVTISYQVAGEGPPLVLLHGLSGSSRWWQRNIRQLAQTFCVYVVDLIGFGASSGLHPFIFDDVAAYLTVWMDRLGIRRANLIGHSMGGMIAADLAATFPDRIERLILVDAAAFLIEQSYTYHLLGLIQEFFHIQVDFLPILIADAYRAGPITLSTALYQVLTTDITSRLARIQAPTLLIWGESDAIVPLAIGKRLCRYLPAHTTIMVIKGAGHNPMWDCPTAFNQLVADFLMPR
jgi:pimeloyl-ACP methyl ester carboxylesterase